MVHRYKFGLSKTLELRALIDEYGRLQRLENGLTPQRRGQRFNDFIAELFTCWGLERVQSCVRGVGEIDVAFHLDGTRFLLEAKWEQHPVSIDPIVKLSRRITQRLAGTRGVFLSMSGYSPEALADIYRGQQSDTLLLDRTHLEAMLSGLLSPSDLFTELLDRASYRGDVYVPFNDLLTPRSVAILPKLEPSGPPRPSSLTTKDGPGIRIETVMYGSSTWDAAVHGFGTDRSGRLLLTTTDGVARFDVPSGAADWAVPIRGCRGNALVLPDESILILMGTAVLRWHQNEVQIVAGGFTGESSLVPGPAEQLWVFDIGSSSMGVARSATLTRLGEGLGQEERHVLDLPFGTRNALWLSQRQFFVAGNHLSGIVDLDKTTSVVVDKRIESPASRLRGALRLDERTILAVAPLGTVYRLDLDSGQQTEIAKLDALLQACELAAISSDRAYVLVYTPPGRGTYRPTVLKLSGYAS